MKLFGYFLIFTSCLAIGLLVFNISNAYKDQSQDGCKFPVSESHEGMKSDFPEDDGWDSGHGEARWLPNPKLSEDLKNGKGFNYSSPSLGEPARLHKLP